MPANSEFLVAAMTTKSYQSQQVVQKPEYSCTRLGQADELVKMRHEDRNSVSHSSEEPVGMSVDFGDGNVRMAIFYEKRQK